LRPASPEMPKLAVLMPPEGCSRQPTGVFPN